MGLVSSWTGFKHIILYDNYSESGELEKTLKEETASSLVTVIPFPLRVAPQLSAYAKCLRIMRHRCRWLAFIDIDEFIVPPAAINDMITNGYDHVRAMLPIIMTLPGLPFHGKFLVHQDIFAVQLMECLPIIQRACHITLSKALSARKSNKAYLSASFCLFRK